MTAGLNLGCGRAPIEGAINVDISAAPGVDLVYDLRVFPWPFPDSAFRRVWCLDVLEHLPDTVATMEEIHRVSTTGATVSITTPHFSCANAFTDPTHCHQFGARTFDYFTAHSTLSYYGRARFGYERRAIVFYPSLKNSVIRRIANRMPEFYERHLCWILPAWFLAIELRSIKNLDQVG